MTDRSDSGRSTDAWPQCDCGYECRGETVSDRVRDAQRHARDAHGIDVSADQILREGHPWT
jgi:hypothetical protein